ncbi:MAG: serine/threonine protein kinase [Prevotella sp.]|nr:serine/threonine protein kinase [Prevotella sp.]
MPYHENSSISGYLTDSFEGISRTFTDFEEVPTPGHNRLVKAKRFGRWWMLKGLKPEASTEAVYRQALCKELEVMLMMQHPGVVQTVGMERVETLGDCIVMEYVDGSTLKNFLEGDSTPALRRTIFGKLVEALAYVHSLGIAHRDLKPENIMVTRNGQNVKIIDFGLADTDAHAILKQPAGTQNYMAPEQSMTARPDVRNDLYSLGLIIIDMQLGHRYERVAAHCLKPIGQRYQSCEELQEDLRRLQSRHTVVRRWLMAALLLVLLAVIGVQTWMLQRGTANRQVIEQRIDSIHRQLEEQQVHDRQQREAMAKTMTQSLGLLGDSIRHLTANNRQLLADLNRLSDAKHEAMTALHREMKHTQIDRHLDTLTQWAWHWPDMSERILRVNRFIYSYCERLDDSFSSDEKRQIQEAMLDEWQKWNQRISQSAGKSYKQTSGKKSLQH